MRDLAERLKAALAERYRIERELGQGGMATVYLAEDLKHDRKVALKVLKPELAAVLGADRFVQEIKTTAGLQHPHILPLFDSGETDGFLYYVMPYIEGETLRDRLDRETQLGIDEAVRITTEVADALDYAHRQGVIHRDIKPENILLHDGRPMVADFGIALAVSAAAGGRMTETGLSLGTPHYMSPEQATAEKDLTNRSDIYSLGCVLYEMLAGNPPHTGSSAQQIIMKIVTDEARPLTELRKSVPANVAAAVAKALEKLVADRFGSAKTFAEALANPAFVLSPSQGAPVAGVRKRSPWNRLSVGLAAALAIVTAALLWSLLRPAPPPQVSRYSVRLPREQSIGRRFLQVAISSDGSRLTYVGGEGRPLWLRRVDQLVATPLTGTEGGDAPFFSPDGDRVAFYFIGRHLRISNLRGGPPVELTDSLVGPAGGSWGPDGVIYSDGLGLVPLVRIAAAGGAPEWFTTLDTASGEVDHMFPDALPNGKGVLFTIEYRSGPSASNIAVADAATGEHRVLLPGRFARYTTTGHLLYVTLDGTLMAVPFDASGMTIEGEPRPLLAGLPLRMTHVPDLAVSDNGTLVYTIGGISNTGGEPVWVDREGRAQPLADGWTDRATGVALSPDGTRLAATLAGDEMHIWIRDLAQQTASRLTFQGVRNERPTWRPDGRAVAFMSRRLSGYALFERRADGTAPARVLLDASPQNVWEGRYTPDGAWLLHRRGGSEGREAGLFALRLGGDSTLVPLTGGSFQEAQPAVSPDGRWLAYVSRETGVREVYVSPFPNVADGRWLISVSGGTEPVWAHSGRELFYRNGRLDLIALPVLPGESFTTGEPRVLFNTQPYHIDTEYSAYDVAPGDQRFVMIRVRDDAEEDDLALIVVMNFFEELTAAMAQ